MRSVVALLACVSALALGVAGCGLGSGDGGTGEVTLHVTEDFGAERVAGSSEPRARSGDTVIDLLERKLDVGTRYGGKFVQELEGRAGGRVDGRPVDWFYYVNGIEADVGGAEFKLSPGDRVWWDLHDWGSAMHIPAVVGAFPEPFVSGYRGKRIPVRIECAEPKGRECDEVAKRLEVAGVDGTSRSVLSQRDDGGVLRVLVGRWSELRIDPTAQRIERGPAQSGVFARFDSTGRRLSLLDSRGRAARTLGAGAGLVAATRRGDAQPVWVVTGTDDVGLAAAAGALDGSRLAQRFALAVENGQGLPAPTTALGS